MSPLRGGKLARLAKKYPKNGGVRKAKKSYKIINIITKNHDVAKIQLLFFLQRNNGLTRQNLTHKNTSLSNAVYSIAQLRVL